MALQLLLMGDNDMVFDICDHEFDLEAGRIDTTAEWAELLQNLEIQDMNTKVGTSDHSVIVGIEQLILDNFQSWVSADLQLQKATLHADSVNDLMLDKIQYWHRNLQHDTAVLHDTKDPEQYAKILRDIQWDLEMKNDYEALVNEMNKLINIECDAKDALSSLKNEGNSQVHDHQYASHYNINNVTNSIKNYEKSIVTMMDKLDDLYKKAIGDR